MKKALDQTIRDLKREVNKKVLKVPTIEQKILDATSNEPWGPHGSLLLDIAQATRNYHEYQMIMIVIWKRISSTGKNWRHVYKALTVLEYLVANGSERVVDEIREHAYQISTLSNFQYLDSSGRDQGQNVRRKSQTLVNLVGDKEKIQEVREKAATNRDKFKSASAFGMSGSGSGSYSGSGYGDRYDDERYEGRYGSRDDDRNGNGRDGEWNRDDDKYGRYADPYARDGDRYNRDSEERYGRGSYRDDEYRGRYADENQDGSRSSERDRDRAYNDEHHSSRGSSVKAEDHPQEGRSLDQKFSVQSPGAPPSYEDAVGGSKSPVSSGRGGDTPSVPVPNSSPPTTSPSPVETTANPNSSLSDPNHEVQAVAEFDPRWSQDAAVSGTPHNAETDLLGSLSDAWAITPVSSAMPSADSSASGPFAESNVTATSSAPATVNQSFEDPFGDSPFKAVPSSDNITTQAQNFASASSFHRPSVNTVEQVHQAAHTTNNFGNSEIPDSLSGLTFTTPEPSTFQLSQNPQQMQQQEPSSFQNDDILAGILPPSGPPPPVASQAQFLPTASQPINPSYNNAPNFAYSSQNFVPQSGHPQTEMAAQHLMMPISQNSGMNSFPHTAPGSVSSNGAPQVSSGIVPQQTNGILGNVNPLAAPAITHSSQPTSTSTAGPLAIVSQPAPKEKFELKSAVWTDTLSRGLVNLDISGAKVNPNAGIGVDFDSLNRKEKRMEKPSTTPVPSTINMGKAMGSGSGMGRSGTNTMRPQSNPIMTSGMGMGMGMGGAPGGGRGMGMGMGGAPGGGMGMGGYGMMNQGQGMGMGIGIGVRGNMGNSMQQPLNGSQPGFNMSGGYNPMMGRGGYPPQNPYRGGYQ